MVIDGRPHGPRNATTACQLYARDFRDGATVDVEPLRAKAFPVVKDLVVDRGALDRIVQAGGYVSAPTGSAPEANAQPVPKPAAEAAFDAAACIGCGACVAACPNASAALFTGAKVTHLVAAMDAEGFGGCTGIGECAAVCPKGIGLSTIARMNRDYLRALLTKR